MNALELFQQFQQDGIVFNVFGRKLKVIAPKGYMTPEKLMHAKSLKADLIKLVTGRKTALVWKVEIDGHKITVIDPHHESIFSIRKSLDERFGAHRIGKISAYL